MQVRVVLMSMAQRGMTVQMRVRLHDWSVMLMLVVAIVNMAVFMLQRHVFMIVAMLFGKVKPQPYCH